MATIDFGRIVPKLEACFARHDLEGAERLLLYWREEAAACGDLRTLTQVDNELLGVYRRLNAREKGLAVASRLLPTLVDDNVGDATVLLNVATNYCHFGLPELAAPLYAKVERTFLAHLPEDDYRLSSFYNNKASMYTSTKQYAAAEQCYRKALDVMRRIEPIMPEMAVTLVNLAVSIYMQNPLSAAVDEAMREAYRVVCLDTMVHDGNFAFVLSKLIPVFRHLGYKDELASLETMLRKVEQNS